MWPPLMHYPHFSLLLLPGVPSTLLLPDSTLPRLSPLTHSPQFSQQAINPSSPQPWLTRSICHLSLHSHAAEFLWRRTKDLLNDNIITPPSSALDTALSVSSLCWILQGQDKKFVLDKKSMLEASDGSQREVGVAAEVDDFGSRSIMKKKEVALRCIHYSLFN